MRYYLLLIFFIGFTHTLTAQKRNEVDSLLRIAETASDSSKADIYLNLAVAYRTLQIDKAYQYARLSLKLAELNKLNKLEADAHNILGSIYRVLGDFDKASEELHEALKLNELLGNSKGIANTANSLGILYFNQEDYQNALNFYQKALNLVDTTQYKGGYATFCLNIGEVYQVMGKYDEAVRLLNEALEVFVKINDLEGLAYTYGVLAKIQLEENQFEIAYTNCEKALAYFREDQNDLGKVEYQLLLSAIYLESGKFQAAENIAFQSLELAKQMNASHWMMNAHIKLAEIYKRMKQFDKAFIHTDSALVLKTKILDEEKQRQIANLRIIYETDKYIQENELLKIDTELKEKRISQQQVITAAIAICLLAIIIFAFFIYRANIAKQRINRLLRIQNEEIRQQREEIQTQAEGLKDINREVVLKNELIEGKNKSITDSLNYAKRIQTALLPFQERITKSLPENFILYKPKDIVSGDFYWFRELGDKVIIVVADCTGHGIPGAFMSLIGHDMLNYICNIKHIIEPNEILSEMKSTVIHLLRQDEGKNRDGMEVSICVWDKKSHIVEFAGANHSLIYIQNNELHQIKGDRATIGKDEFKHFNSFTKHEIAVTSDSEFYLFTDGYMDQFGGAENKKFMFGSFKELIFKNHLKQMNTQKQILEETLQDWQGEEEQVDDILIFGFRLMD